MAVDNCHDFGALAAFGRPNAKPQGLEAALIRANGASKAG